MTTDLGVLLPIRIETRFKNGDLWLRVVPDEPWFVRGGGDERTVQVHCARRAHLSGQVTPRCGHVG